MLYFFQRQLPITTTTPTKSPVAAPTKPTGGTMCKGRPDGIKFTIVPTKCDDSENLQNNNNIVIDYK